MQREIKFRGQRIDNNELVYGYYYYKWRTKQHVIHCGEQSGIFVDAEFEVTPESVGQYTGLHDKNGVEIYEGDVLEICNGSINGHKWPEPNRVVKYEKTGFNLHDFMWDKNGNSAMDSTHYCEIIGNTHTNPELLNNN